MGVNQDLRAPLVLLAQQVLPELLVLELLVLPVPPERLGRLD